MASTKGQYDPVKAVEGMFNGSVTRIAYMLKDPINYGGNTKAVLAECAKKFQDALDDCEIQLLEAKWYLEHQLRTNQLRREAQSREMGTAAKRKHDETKDTNDTSASEETAAKKAKTELHQDKAQTVEELSKPKGPVAPNMASQDIEANKPKPTDAKQAAEDKEEQKKEAQTTQPMSKPSEPVKPIPKEPPPPIATASIPDDFAKPTPQATPTGTNDDFSFDLTMFGEPTGGDSADVNKLETDLDFDFTTGDFTGGMSNENDQDPTSLGILLPGLETYAKQLDDNPTDNPPNNPSNKIDGASKSNDNAVQETSIAASNSNNFDLPDIGGEPNIFDDLLNDENMGAGGNFGNTPDPNDTSFFDLDFLQEY